MLRNECVRLRAVLLKLLRGPKHPFYTPKREVPERLGVPECHLSIDNKFLHGAMNPDPRRINAWQQVLACFTGHLTCAVPARCPIYEVQYYVLINAIRNVRVGAPSLLLNFLIISLSKQ